MPEHVSITGDPHRWPHLEASYVLAAEAAQGFAPDACADSAFTAARWGFHMGCALARLDPEWAAALSEELDDFDLTRDGLEAMTFARYSMLEDAGKLRRLAERFASLEGE